MMQFKILVVEDEILIAMEVEDALLSAGYELLGPVASVQEALALLRDVRPDAAVLDVNLAGERVTPVAEVLGASDIPFLLASGYGATELAGDRALRNATNVGKPFNAQRLIGVLRGLLEADGRTPA